MTVKERAFFDSWKSGLDLSNPNDVDLLLVRVIRVFVETADCLLRDLELHHVATSSNEEIMLRYHSPYNIHKRRIPDSESLAKTEINV